MKNSNRGFTLIEVVIAVSILLGGILVIANSWSGNNLRIRKARLNNNVAVLIERKMAELDATYRGQPLEKIPKEDSGDFGKEFKQYSWAFSSQEFEMPDLSSILIQRDNGANEMLLTVMKQLKEIVNKSVKELTLRIIVKTARKQVEYTVTTYFVDYSKGLAAGSVGQ